MSVLNKELTEEQQLDIAINDWLVQNKDNRACIVRLFERTNETDEEETIETTIVNAGDKVLIVHGAMQCLDDKDDLLCRLKGGNNA